MRQYLGESMIMTAAATLIAVALYEAFKLKITQYLPRDQLVDFYADPGMLASVIGLMVIVGVLGGFYPALYLSRFRPIAVLQGKTSAKSSRSLLRKSLVVLQFGIAALFVFCTITFIRQTSLVTSMELGFETEDIVILEFDGQDAARNCLLMRDEIMQHNRVVSVTASNCPPGIGGRNWRLYYTTEERVDEKRLVTRTFEVDYDFISSFGLEVVEGRGLAPGEAASAGIPIVVTQATIEELGPEAGLGSKLYSSGEDVYEIVGVLKDFHSSPLDHSYHAEVVLEINDERYNTLAVKMPSDDIAGSLAGLRQTWEATLPDYPFDYSFLDEAIDANYGEDRGQVKVAGILSIFTIGIACLGIFGLVSYTAEQRTREIGIRKVLGASVPGIVKMLSKEFVILIIIANVIAQPFGFLLMSDILSWSPFKVSIGLGTILTVCGIGLFFALATASFQSIKAALANPVDSLRSE